jgi:cytochrome d ubiquinol oxidase subunit II
VPQVYEVTAWIMLIALVVYTLLGGADFGAGVWDLLATGPRRARQRDVLAHAIGPIWEANHVWLIVVIVLMFTCFPPAFAAIMTALHVPILLVLLGIVLRGSSFVFRTYTPPDRVRARALWGEVFAIASLLTPVMLGVTLGALATGRLLWDDRGVYISGFIEPWALSPLCWSVGLFTLAIFAYLAAVYLCAEDEPFVATDPLAEVGQAAPSPPGADAAALREDFRIRALAAAVAVGVLAGVTWLLAVREAPLLSRELWASWWAIPLQIATGLAAVTALWALWTRRYALARAAAVLQVTLIVVGYGAAIFPYLVVPQVTIEASAAPARMHRLVLGALAAGAVILLPSLWYLLRSFKGERAFTVIDRPAPPPPVLRG